MGSVPVKVVSQDLPNIAQRSCRQTAVWWLLGGLLFPHASGTASPDTLRIATDNNYPPYVVIGVDGLPEGYIADLWQLWARKTGVKVEMQALQWAEAQRSVLDGKADAIDMIFRTPTSEQLYDFSQPYATVSVSIYVDSSIQGVTNVQSLRGFTIGVQRGDACADSLTAQGVTNLIAFPSYQDILSAAADGQIKMFCMDDEPASYYLYLRRDQVRFAKAFKLYEKYFHWAVNRGDQNTFDLIHRGMEQITAEEHRVLKEKWFSQPFEFRPYLRTVLAVILVALVSISLAGLWIYFLRRSVRARTVEILRQHQQVEVATRELRKEKALLRAIIDNSPDAMALKSLDGAYLDFNAGGLSLLNRSREQVVGKTDDEIFPDKSFVHAIRDRDVEVIRSGKSLQYETYIDFPDQAKRLADVNKVLVRESDGTPAGILVVVRDITDRRQAERELGIAAVAFEGHDGMMITDSQSVIERVNSAFSRITGHTPADAVGKGPNQVLSVLKNSEINQALQISLANQGHWQGEVECLDRNGRVYSARLSVSKVMDAKGNTTHYLYNLQDITAEKEAQELALHLKLFDPLTELPNRLLIGDRMAQAISRCGDIQTCGAVFMIDLDRFQKINDSLGHGFGDRLLVEVTRRMRHVVRDGDTLGRFSGDKFVLLVENLGGNLAEAASRAQALSDSVRLSVEVPLIIEQHRLVCTVSIGITMFCEQTVDPEALLKQAELAMYRSKSGGRNKACFFEESMQTEISRRSQIENELREAIAQKQLTLYYQLQVDASGQAIGVEALVRWIHPQRGIVSPRDFIPLAEETGLIEPIGSWALATACQQLALWARNPLTRSLTIAVNVSPRQFRSDQFVATVHSQVQRAGVRADQIKLEVTESVAIDDLDDSISKLQALSVLGFKVSLDDFGTGNSSLNVLTKLPLTQLKIDKSFVDELPHSDRDAMVVQTIINMGRGLDLNVIAEGVETPAQYHFLRDQGCAAFQGYLFGRPMPIEEFEASLLMPRSMDVSQC